MSAIVVLRFGLARIKVTGIGTS
jgi:hypothetical protein